MYIRVRVTPGVKKEFFREAGEHRFEAAVSEPAEGNRANRRILELVAEHYHISVKQIRIINGHHSPAKMLSIDDTAASGTKPKE